MISRRRFLGTGAIAAVGCAVGSYAHYDITTDLHTGAIEVENVPIKSAAVPPAFNGYKIGFLSDLHLGIWVPEHWITRALELVAAQNVDLLVLGGDYICVNEDSTWEDLGFVRNEKYTGLQPKIATRQLFSDVVRLVEPYAFRDGIIAVAGNHEHWNSTSTFLDMFSRSAKIRLMINQEIFVRRAEQSMRIYGVDDYLTGIPRLPSMPSRLSKDRVDHEFRLLVSHNPDLLTNLLDSQDDSATTYDLALCGHTHGGQVCIPGIGAPTYQVSDRRFGSGLVSVQNTLVYTSRGVGVVGVPYRLHCPPEATIIELQSA